MGAQHVLFLSGEVGVGGGLIIDGQPLTGARGFAGEVGHMLDASPPADAGILVMNPPYGERMGDEAELAAFYPKLGDVLKQRFAGWTAYIFTSDLRLPKLIRLTASRRIPLYNGALECRLFKYELVAGSRRRERKVTRDA